MEEKTSKTRNPFVRFGRWCADTAKWLFDFKDWKLLLRSVPGLVTTVVVLCTVIMNLLASKTIIITDPSWFGVTGGIILSAFPFICFDITTKTFGAKASTKLTILALLINLVCVGLFQLISVIQIGGDPNQYAAFNATFSQTWQIFVASSIAFLASGVINNVINAAIGKMFRKNPDGKAAYMTRTYVSTMVGQFLDNFIFTALAFLVFFNLSIGTTLGWTIWTTIGAAIFGAVLELLLEVVLSPVGYKICQKWRADNVGAEYLAYCKEKELKADIGRITY